MDVVPWLQLGGLGIVGVVLWYLVRLIGGGKWFPRDFVDGLIRQYDARLAELREQVVRAEAVAAEWRAAHETSEHTRELLNHQNRDLLDALRDQRSFLDAIRNAATFAAVDRADRAREEGSRVIESRSADGDRTGAGGPRGG